MMPACPQKFTNKLHIIIDIIHLGMFIPVRVPAIKVFFLCLFWQRSNYD